MILNFIVFLTSFWGIMSCQTEDMKVEPFLEISQDTLVCVQKETNITIQVKTNVDWKVSVTDADEKWCKITKSDDSFTIGLSENKESGIRQTDIKVVSGALSKKMHVKQLGQEPDILIAESRINLNYGDTLIHINVASNVEYTVTIPDTVDWITPVPEVRTMVESTKTFQVGENLADAIRFTNIVFKSSDGTVERPVLLRQEIKDKQYVPGTSEGMGDVLIPINRATADQAQSNENIELSFDGNTSTWYHSPWSGTVLPVTLDYFFDTPQVIDYFIYSPRGSGDNGNFGQFDLYMVRADNKNYEKVESYDFKGSSTFSKISFAESYSGVTSVRFVVKSGTGGFVSCGEMEFYRRGEPITGLDAVFADDIYSELKPGVTQGQIGKIENKFFRSIAQSLFDKTYNLSYRVQEFEPYRDRNDLAAEMKTSGYCPFENATGIYFGDGEEVVLFVGDTKGEKIQLKVYDFDGTRQGISVPEPTVYPLEKGLNKVRISHGGLAYIDYFTLNWKTARNIKVHIPSGTVNGYFDRNKHTASDWMKILNGATYGCLDIKGDYVNLIYGVGSLKRYCKEGMDLIKRYDDITLTEQELMGLIKYNRRPKNHMFARVVKSGLFADGWGAGFAEDCMNELADPAKVTKEGVWCIAHELGHVNQIRPGLKWVSTTEVTNNVYSIYARYKYNREYMNLEQERVNDGDNNHVLGGRFNSYLNYGIVKGEQWLCQRGQDKMEGYENGGDHFVKLCPLWQLLLYYREIAGKRDWYGEVAEIVRLTDDTNFTNGELQLNFMKNTCDVVQEDLTDFFIKAGMLKPIDKDMDDYSRGQLTITQSQCDELVRYASKYPKPATPVLYYLTANSEKAYKERLSVQGVYGEGVKVRDDGRLYVEHAVWKNVVVFETYQGNTLIKVAMVGTDSQDLSSTLVRYPQGATRVEAVGWNGERTLVYGTR